MHSLQSRNVTPGLALTSSATSTDNRSAHSDFESPELQKELVHLYFTHIHDKHHSLFHEPTIMSQLSDGSIPKVLFHGMMALGAR